MTIGSLAALALVYFLTAVITVITGSTSLITIPVMLQFGIEPRTAVATNMLALGMLSLGGVLPFIGASAIDKPRAPWLIALTFVGSILGALLLFAVPSKWMNLIIPVAMISVLAALLLQPRAGPATPASPKRARTGYIIMALLSVYGGFLSGGYATLVTTAGIVFFRYPMLRGIAMAKVLNTVSSLVAVAVFARYGMIDWRLGVVLSAAGFLGGLIGTHWARRMPATLLRRLFLFAVATLALKSMLFDVPWNELAR